MFLCSTHDLIETGRISFEKEKEKKQKLVYLNKENLKSLLYEFITRRFSASVKTYADHKIKEGKINEDHNV